MDGVTRRLAALLLTLALTACSGSGDEQGGATPEVDPKQAYVEAASTICGDAQEQFAALPAPSAPADFGPYVTQTVRLVEQVQTDLAALDPPEQDRAEIESKVLTPLSALVEQGKVFSARVTAAGADEAQLLPLLGQRPTSAAIDKQFLRSYGLDTCAEAVSLVG